MDKYDSTILDYSIISHCRFTYETDYGLYFRYLYNNRNYIRFRSHLHGLYWLNYIYLRSHNVRYVRSVKNPRSSEIGSHNVCYDNSVKSTIYSKFTRWLIKPIRYVKSYYTFMQHTRLLEYLFSYLTFLLVIVFFYFLTIFLCAVDDSCAAIYMGGA